jgi:hypothetical protein
MAIRKIRSEQEIRARQKRIQIIASIVMVSLLIFATAGYFVSELLGINTETSLQQVTYAGKTFFKQDDLFYLIENNKQFYFYDLPNVSRGVYDNKSSLQEYSQKPLYIVNMQPQAYIILLNLEGQYSRWQGACFKEDCQEKLPIKNCSENLVIFSNVESNISKVEKQENCIFISGNPQVGVDAFLYSLLDIK